MLVAIRRRRLPNFGRTEVRVIGIRVPDALNDRDHALVVKRLERAHVRIQADVRVDRQHVVAMRSPNRDAAGNNARRRAARRSSNRRFRQRN